MDNRRPQTAHAACPIQTQRIAVGLIALNERTICLQIVVVLLIFDRAFVHLIN